MNERKTTNIFADSEFLCDAIGLISDDLLEEYDNAIIKKETKARILPRLLRPSKLKVISVAASLVLIVGGIALSSGIMGGLKAMAPNKEEALPQQSAVETDGALFPGEISPSPETNAEKVSESEDFGKEEPNDEVQSDTEQKNEGEDEESASDSVFEQITNEEVSQ